MRYDGLTPGAILKRVVYDEVPPDDTIRHDITDARVERGLLDFTRDIEHVLLYGAGVWSDGREYPKPLAEDGDETTIVLTRTRVRWEGRPATLFRAQLWHAAPKKEPVS